MWKEKNVSREMESYIEKILQRDQIPYSKNWDGKHFSFSLDISNSRFSKIYEQALCVKNNI